MKHGMKMLVLAGALALVMPMAACSTLASLTGNIVQSSSTASPTQAKTLAEGIQMATLTTRAVEAVVNTHTLDTPTLEKIRAANNAVQASLHVWKDADAAHQSLASASFNAALAAFNSYRSTMNGS